MTEGHGVSAWTGVSEVRLDDACRVVLHETASPFRRDGPARVGVTGLSGDVGEGEAVGVVAFLGLTDELGQGEQHVTGRQCRAS
ncbi:hypothetical protein ABT278_05205 [Streptomyces sp. NPDC001228]|uniref:hypothetical protein n=1 Tax=Streptomyces sp. NPDC001228 TaxID=3154381 RepID=UPI00332C3C4C